MFLQISGTHWIEFSTLCCWVGLVCGNPKCIAQDSETADLVVWHAEVHTMNISQPIAQAVAIRGG